MKLSDLVETSADARLAAAEREAVDAIDALMREQARWTALQDEIAKGMGTWTSVSLLIATRYAAALRRVAEIDEEIADAKRAIAELVGETADAEDRG